MPDGDHDRRRVKRLIALAALVLAAVLLAVALRYLSDPARKIRPSVVSLIVYDKSGRKSGEGSGFFIDGGRVVTSLHWLVGAARADIVTSGGKRYPVTAVSARDAEGDLAILDTACPASAARPLKFTPVRLLEREKTIVVGGGGVWRGRLGELRLHHRLGSFATTLFAIPTMASGGPVVNEDGRLVGVLVSRVVDGIKVRYVIPTRFLAGLKPGRPQSLAEFAAQNPVEWPDTADGLYRKGAALCIAEEWGQALRYMEKALKKDPRHFEATLRAGNCHRYLKDYPAAVELLERAVKLKPDDSYPLLPLGVVYGRQHRYKKRWRR